MDDCSPQHVAYRGDDCNPLEALYERRCAKYIYVVPEGLRELMSDITREVLRCQPKQVYCFIADYLDALMITRENARVAALFVEDVTETGATLREIIYKTRLTMSQAIRAARIIQRAFRRHLSRKRLPYEQIEPIDPYLIICKLMVRLNITYDKASEAARIIQRAWRCYKMRMDTWQARFEKPLDWREAARYTLRIYKRYAACWEYTRAATLIQAAYRGYYTRRYMRLLARKKPKCPEEDVLTYLIHQYTGLEGEEGGEEKHAITYDEPEIQLYTPDEEEIEYEVDERRDRAARIIQKVFKRFISKIHAAKDAQHDLRLIDDILEGEETPDDTQISADTATEST